MSTVQTLSESLNPYGFARNGQEDKVIFKIFHFSANLFSWVAVTLKKKSHLLNAMLIWRPSEWSMFLYRTSDSTNETPIIPPLLYLILFFIFIFQALEWLFLLGELGNKR